MATGIEANLERKLGPLPVWAWTAVSAGGFYVYARHKMTTTAAATAAAAAASQTDATSSDIAATDTGTDTSSGAMFDPNVPIDSWWTDNPGAPSFPVGSTAQGLPSPVINQQWARLATDKLLSLGADPSLVANALNDYLAGKALNRSEQAIINEAQQFFGAPPEGILPVASTPPPSGGGGGGTPPPSGFNDQFHYVGALHGAPVSVQTYIRQMYPKATAAQLANIYYWTIADPRNKNVWLYLLKGQVPGGTPVTLAGSKANNGARNAPPQK